MCTLLLDERRSPTKDLFVFAGVIVRTAEIPSICIDLETAARTYAGTEEEELKYSPDTGSAQDTWCRKHSIKSGDAKTAVLDVIARRGVRGATIVAGIVLDPRGSKTRITDAEVYSWGYDAVLQRWAKFLESRTDRRDGGLNEVVMDTPAAEPHRFHALYRAGWRLGWRDLPFRIPSLRSLRCRDELLSSVARFAPALWLADHVAGAVSDWVRIERQVDLASLGSRPPPKAVAQEAARARLRPVLPNIRSPVAGGGLVPWPRDQLDKPQLQTWVSRTRVAPTPSAAT